MKNDKATDSKDEITLVKLASEYGEESTARALFERLRWPNGPQCPYCAAKEPYRLKLKPIKNRPARDGMYKCRECRKQFTATKGTILESSHIPIQKWLMAFSLIASSKKSVSAHQMHRCLGIDYKSAWFMCHRIRHAVKYVSNNSKLSGNVEMDETFVGGKNKPKSIVMALIERGGKVRTKVIDRITHRNVGKFMRDNIARGSTLNTDANPRYKGIYLPAVKHDAVNHSAKEFQRERADGSKSHVNSCESYFSLFKRGITGAFHHISPQHLPRYCDEFSFRWDTRELTDGERFEIAVGMSADKRLMYRETVSA